MPIISKETWDKFTQEEKDKIIEWNNHLTQNQSKHKSYSHDYDEHYNNGFADGRLEMLDDLFGKEALQPQPLTYEDVARELFKDGFYFIDCNGKATYINRLSPDAIKEPNNCTSQKQAEKLLAINRLLNVAKFLNGKDWKPDWNNLTSDDKVWSLGIDENEIRAYYVQKYDGARPEIVYFRTEDLAKQAIQILGENTIRLALSSDY